MCYLSARPLPWALTVMGLGLAASPLSAQIPPGASGATSSSTYTQSVSRTQSNTLTFSRDQTFVISGSNVSLAGPITAAGGPLGGVTSVEYGSQASAGQLFPTVTVTSSSPLPSSGGLVTSFGEASSTTTSGSGAVSVTLSDNTAVTALVLNPSMNATIRDPAKDFDLAVTQGTPGLTQAQRSDVGTTTSQIQTSLSVFTAPFVP